MFAKFKVLIEIILIYVQYSTYYSTYTINHKIFHYCEKFIKNE